jgi:glucose/mannose-6-phosphate isomerase
MKYQRKDLAQFPNEIRYAVSHYKPAGIKASDFSDVLLGGLGGSGIAGRIAKSYFSDSFPLPVEVVSDYSVPAYVNAKTLAILNSYSGNTEETLTMYDEVKRRGCRIIVITTGGKLAEKAIADNNSVYYPEKGYQPRMSLGYSLSYLFMLFAEMMGENIGDKLLAAADTLNGEEKYIQKARDLFSKFKEEYPKKIVAITDGLTYPIGVRMEQQIEENSKAQAFVHILPESNHNVIESYYGNMDSVFLMLNSHSNKRVDLRFSFLEDLLRKKGNTVIDLEVNSSLTGLLETIYVLDWLSLVIAEHKDVNSASIENINALKDFLSKS